MKKILLFFTLPILSLLSPIVHAQEKTPTLYKTPSEYFKTTGSNSKYYTFWEADLKENGNKIILVGFYDEIIEKIQPSNSMREWTILFQPQGQNFWMEIKGVITPYSHKPNLPFNRINPDPRIDPDCCYVGYISELKKYGIISRYLQIPEIGPTTLYIFAYTMEGEYLRKTYLFEDTIAKENGKYPLLQNPIYLKYLSEEKRTKITPQKLPSSS